MKQNELIQYIKNEVKMASFEKKADAVNMYLVIKYANQLKDIDPTEFSLGIGRKESYKTEFRKGLKLAEVIKDRGL
jgi:hypothetical protein